MEFPTPETLIQWITLGIMSTFTALISLSYKQIVAFAKAKIHSGIFDFLRKWAHTYVTALMQDPTLKGLASEEKKQMAMIWLINKAEQYGIKLSTDEASKIIEQAVYLAKSVVLAAAEDALDGED